MDYIRTKEYLVKRLHALKTERESFIAHYRDLSDFISPRRGRYFLTDRNKGDKRITNIINSKATQALKVARAGMLSGVMSPSRPWFALETPDPDMMEFAPVKEWLYKVEMTLRAVFNDGNLYNMAPVMLGELLQFGTGCMLHVDHFENVARFYTQTAGSYMLAQDDELKVRTVMREFQMQTGQMIKKFGKENVSLAVVNAYDRGNYDEWFDVAHMIEPNPEHEKGSPVSNRFPFRSIMFEPKSWDSLDDKPKYLEIKGFREFPAYCPRWEVTGEDIYATDCPGMTALPDIKGLQIEEKRKAQAIDKMVNPPLRGPASLRNQPVSSLPGGLTVYDGNGNQGDALQPIYQVEPDIRALMEDIKAVEARIDRAFFVDMFLAISTMDGIQPRNEFELSQRNQERLLQLGPVLEQLHGEFLDPLIDRTFNQCARAGILPPAPEELRGQALKVNYISTLAMAQRAVATQGIDRLAAYTAGLVKAGWTGALDKFDADQSVDEYANVIGVPPKVVVPDDVVAQRRAERQRMEQMAAAAEVAKTAAEAGAAGASAAVDAQEAMAGALQ